MYLFLIEPRALNDNSSGGSKPSLFKRQHEAIGQSLQQCVVIIRGLQKIYIYFLDCKLIEPLQYKGTAGFQDFLH